ncbi:hypothetical protein Kpol_461p12 [Vanderwaltozyma polyspora DSM 70294]|uniref:Sas10 C-terminal domain-containing protein n=1 Tax=Vanderwaltozyma polyspora (strain ATCC 22028 / DSM 70294 / BCRC 21397 / CBS 2163 / NBRC 10782 / NRRL Y-8283 / UCD 57-17) TaxID=436907 RepID=A7TR48_VANPO|nr:uncharacterized protein Kpol_461p12 [Vanderwaltozyma polyspora DSM 70294]EDO15258.1 hypothetical protein Kpol_461p12 [Vanderwaltozyma polyspora DSM 70294]
MARRNGGRAVRGSGVEDSPYGKTEIDDFADKREKVLLEQSSLGGRGGDAYDDEDGLNVDDEEEEVMGISDDESGSDEEEEELDGAAAYRKVFGRKLDTGVEDGGDEEEAGGMLENDTAWGSTKGEYYGADEIEDDEAAKEIEKEALRQQKKHLQDLNMEDYLDDEVEEEWAKSAKEFDMGEFRDTTKQSDQNVTISDIKNMSDEAKINYLKTMFPEFLPLSKELSQLSPVLEMLKSQDDTEFVKIKVMALSSYLATISSYFSILLLELNNNDESVTMKDHPVMESILTSKEVWRQASELPSDFDAEDDQDSDVNTEAAGAEDVDVGSDEEQKLNDQDDSDEGSDEEEEEEDEEEEDVDLDDFEEYVAQSRISKNKANKSKNDEDIDDFIETEMTEVDAHEKKQRKKTLRFYTSKIDQQAGKKADKFKGDDDIPYKERLFERQQRLLEEARRRGMHDKHGADLDNNDADSDDERVSKSINKSSEEDYYAQVQKNKADKKSHRAQTHKDAVKAAREGKLAELAEELGDGGKRAINYQILKNKGLTPKRKKDNRNSRVKKRKKYEKAQKKLKSVRAVYSGGQSGAYEGEKTGIKKNLTRSVKFRN